MNIKLQSILMENSKIAAVKNEIDLEKALLSSTKIIFILSSNICSIEEMTRKVKAQNKICFIHLDMVQGLNSKENSALTFLKENTFADGIITTKSQVARTAKKIGFLVILRCFLIDSISLNTTLKHLSETNYIDAMEILPGVIPKIIKKITMESSIPVIAGGLICDEEDVEIALNSGAMAVSTTKLNLIN